MKPIEITGLNKSYGKARGVKNVSLSLEKGDFLGFIGPNGAGKSTTIRTLLGFLKPDQGEVLVFGKDIQKDRTEILKKTGYLPSETILYPQMKVRELLKYSADLRNMDCSEEAASLCRRLQLDPERKIRDLSLGNRKKAGIVLALQHRPDLLILDEPSSGLDPLIQKEFFDLLHERNREGATILLSSHQLSEVQRHCTKAALIRDGEIIASDSMTHLLSSRSKKIHVLLWRPEDLNSLLSELNTAGHAVLLKAQEEASDREAEFLYEGEPDDLFCTLSRYSLQDASVSDAGLEDLFLHYFTENKEAEDGTEAEKVTEEKKDRQTRIDGSGKEKAE